ncbi:MAG: tRNA preQ1(34) S-adenosylmethionine ribosyltransferase-isomerase QueA [Pirellulaceae bacterium]
MSAELQLVSHYDFDLPKNLIAQQPLERRDDARLLVVDRAQGTIEHQHVRDLPEVLASGDLLVLNDSRVIPAKLVGFRARTRGRWQGLFLENEHGVWKVLSKTRGKLEPGEEVILQDRKGQESLTLVMVAKLSGGAWAAMPQSDRPFLELLEQVGRVPLPHYIREGNMMDEDVRRYQTVYATKPGSVAAPTAGLHMTKPLIEKLINSGKGITRVTLHVGLGTFKPMATELLAQHEMHFEWGQIDEKAIRQIEQCQTAGKRVIAVGTTSVRVLETAARQLPLVPWEGNTDLFIRPGFDFRLINGLLTNFHLPRSTLLVLVRTFGGDELIRHAYEVAVAEKYRFFSYGDAMLVL